MQYALDPTFQARGEAEKSLQGFVCPVCKSQVIPKCGEIYVHHWAHRNAGDCDPWYEPESDWHRRWKGRLAPPAMQEVVMQPHRADVIGRNDAVIELQRSHIGPEVMRQREEFYGEGMIWLLDAKEWWLEETPQGVKYRKKSLLQCQRSIFLDMGGFMIWEVVEKGDKLLKVNRWTYVEFIDRFRSEYPDQAWLTQADAELDGLRLFLDRWRRETRDAPPDLWDALSEAVYRVNESFKQLQQRKADATALWNKVVRRRGEIEAASGRNWKEVVNFDETLRNRDQTVRELTAEVGRLSRKIYQLENQLRLKSGGQ